jgi:hypothetical protein
MAVRVHNERVELILLKATFYLGRMIVTDFRVARTQKIPGSADSDQKHHHNSDDYWLHGTLSILVSRTLPSLPQRRAEPEVAAYNIGPRHKATSPAKLGLLSRTVKVQVEAGSFTFEGTFETANAPQTCAWFATILPFESSVIHARWSGEAVWVPLGNLESGLALENHTAHPSRGDLLFYPGGISETEILFAYGSSSFAAKTGALAGNHFITITSGREQLAEFGNAVLWEGARQIKFTTIE